jgi:hypothetical protein
LTQEKLDAIIGISLGDGSIDHKKRLYKTEIRVGAI